MCSWLFAEIPESVVWRLLFMLAVLGPYTSRYSFYCATSIFSLFLVFRWTCQTLFNFTWQHVQLHWFFFFLFHFSICISIWEVLLTCDQSSSSSILPLVVLSLPTSPSFPFLVLFSSRPFYAFLRISTSACTNHLLLHVLYFSIWVLNVFVGGENGTRY